jgi:diaminobutyrate-2-oxoglutarate transaminase
MTNSIDEAAPPDALQSTYVDESIFEERESSVRSYCRSFPTTFSLAKGAHLTDVAGRDYIDFLAGAGALNFGHNHDTIKSAIIEYLMTDGLSHGLDLHTVAKQRFLESFDHLVLQPRGLDYRVQFTGPTGTNSVEAALKIARKVTGRTGIFSFMGGYHGDSLGSLSATANRSHREAAGVPLHDVTFLPFPAGVMGEIDTLTYLRSILLDTHSGIELPAGIIVETTQAEGGVNVAPTEWLRDLAAICHDYGILLIIDEIQTGVGRTGPFFSFERAGIVPDIVTVSKSISGYGLPMSLTLLKPEHDFWQPGDHTGTFRGNQLAFIAATVALELFTSERITEQVATHATTIERALNGLNLIDERIGVRGLGMLWGADTAAIDPTGAVAMEISQRCFADGLIIERVGRNDTVLKVLPPLNIDELSLVEGLSILHNATRACLTR